MASIVQPIVWPGRPYPLGATWDGEGVNFALYSEHAEKVELCLFDNLGKRETTGCRFLSKLTWSGTVTCRRRVPASCTATGHTDLMLRNKACASIPTNFCSILTASRFKGRIHWSDSHFGYKVGHKQEDLSFDRRDNAAGMPKNRVIDSAFTWGADSPPRIPWHKTLIYELHVKGFTMCHPDVPANLRGTYAGLGDRPHYRLPHPAGSDFD